jgi:hypothetical protein
VKKPPIARDWKKPKGYGKKDVAAKVPTTEPKRRWPLPYEWLDKPVYSDSREEIVQQLRIKGASL